MALILAHPTLNNKPNAVRTLENVKLVAKSTPVQKLPQAAPPQTPAVAPEPAPEPAPTPPAPSYEGGSHEDWMSQAGISPSDFTYVDYIVSHESSWGIYATEPTSGAYGLCQSLPATKMASAGSDWQSNPITQLSWCNSYAQSAYGGWANAYYHWVNNRWW